MPDLGAPTNRENPLTLNSAPAGQTASTFQAVANAYIAELIEDGRGNYGAD